MKKEFKLTLIQKIIDLICPCFGSKRILDGSRVKIRRAPEPTDVIWENICYSKCNKVTSRLITSVITALLVGAGFAVIVGISYG